MKRLTKREERAWERKHKKEEEKKKSERMMELWMRLNGILFELSDLTGKDFKTLLKEFEESGEVVKRNFQKALDRGFKKKPW